MATDKPSPTPPTTDTTPPLGPLDAPPQADPNEQLEAIRKAIFTGAVQWKDDELDADKVYMTSRAVVEGQDIRRVVNKTNRRAGYAIVKGGRMVSCFPVADSSGVLLTRETARPGMWLSDPQEVEGALVARAQRDAEAKAVPPTVPL